MKQEKTEKKGQQHTTHTTGNTPSAIFAKIAFLFHIPLFFKKLSIFAF